MHLRFEECRDAASTRQFLLDYVEKIVFANDKVALHGKIPVKQGQRSETETNMLIFVINGEITKEDRYEERMRTAEAMKYQQSVALLREQNTRVLPSAGRQKVGQ